MPLSPTRDEALAAFEAARREHQEFLASIPRERMTEPGATGPWSVKDVIAHLTAWRGWTLARLEAAVAGQLDAPAPWPSELQDTDQINQWLYERHRDEPLDAVLAGWDASFDRVRALSMALPEDALYETSFFPWFEGFSLIDALAIGYLGHFNDEHESVLRAWLAGDGA